MLNEILKLLTIKNKEKRFISSNGLVALKKNLFSCRAIKNNFIIFYENYRFNCFYGNFKKSNAYQPIHIKSLSTVKHGFNRYSFFYPLVEMKIKP